MPKALTEEILIKRFREQHGTTYNYSNLGFVVGSPKVTIGCKLHGAFIQNHYHHITGSGCPKCGRIKANKTHTLSTEGFIKRSNILHKGLYTYSKTVYVRNDCKVKISCKEHGEFEQSPNNHLAGNGCPKCADYLRGLSYYMEPTLLYYIRINKSTPLFKIGITLSRLGVTERFRKEKFSYHTLRVIEYPTGDKAYVEEQRILNSFKEFKYKGVDVLKEGGNSELFTKDVLCIEKI